MRTRHATILLAAPRLLALTACGPPGDVGKGLQAAQDAAQPSVSTRSRATTRAAAAARRPGPNTGTALDFGAVNLEEACPRRSPTNAAITVKDGGPQGRVVVVGSNWRVCTQTPPMGTPLDGRPVTFHVVKFLESCS